MNNDPVRPLRILVVDDCTDNRESMRILLELVGYDVAVAPDGPAALATAAGFRPDVVLLDVGLPGMDGYEVARRMQQVEALEGALLLALTGFGRDVDVSRALRAGFDRHLTKPVDPEELHAILRERARLLAQAPAGPLATHVESSEGSAGLMR